MISRYLNWTTALWFAAVAIMAGRIDPVRAADGLDPVGEVHVPVGIANTVDSLKTFVEAEGNFSPGFATYGIYFWIYDRQAKRLIAPTMPDVPCDRGLAGTGYLIPWASWQAGHVAVRTEVCQVLRESPPGNVQVVAARIRLTNDGDRPSSAFVYAVLRPLGPAGGPVHGISVSEKGEGLSP